MGNTPHPSPKTLLSFQIEHYSNRVLNATTDEAKRFCLSELRRLDKENKSGLTKRVNKK